MNGSGMPTVNVKGMVAFRALCTTRSTRAAGGNAMVTEHKLHALPNRGAIFHTHGIAGRRSVKMEPFVSGNRLPQPN